MALTADLWARGGNAIALIPNAFAVKIHKDATGQAKGVTWRNTITGELSTETARVVVLSAGCIESPRLWLNSGLPNTNGWVGRGLTDHHKDMVVGILPHDSGTSRGPASAARAAPSAETRTGGTCSSMPPPKTYTPAVFASSITA